MRLAERWSQLSGSGPVALFIHGFPLSGFQWRGALERLADIRRCIAPDLMGLGSSEVADGQDLSPGAQADMLVAFLDRLSIPAVDLIAKAVCGAGVSVCSWEDQLATVRAVQHTSGTWRGMPSGRVWSLWTRYAVTAFYSHPWAWDEIGFGGPAYPRGYKNIGMGALEPWEVPDARPGLDPVDRGSSR